MEITLCKEKYGEGIMCGIDIAILVLCSIIFLLNCYALIIMCKMLKTIKFENTVIICGIFQSIILIFVILTNWELLILLILFGQVMIYLFVLRRFLRIFFRMRRKSYEPKTNYYNLFFYLNSLINIGLTVGCYILVLITPNEKPGVIVQSLQSLYSFVISFLLFYFGFNVKRILIQSVRESDNNSFTNYIGENVIKDDTLTKSIIIQDIKHPEEFKETYFKVRKLQIDLIIYISLLSGIYQATYLSLKNTLIFDQFDNTGFKSIPKTTLTYMLHLIYILCSTTTIILNFFAFFYIVRSSYYEVDYKSKRSSANYFSQESFVRISTVSRNKDIDLYLK